MHQSSQFHLCPAPSAGLLRASARLVSPRGGAFAYIALPRGRAFANPRAIPGLLHTRGFLSEYNYTEGCTGKNANWLIYQGQE